MNYDLKPGFDRVAFLRSVDRCKDEVVYEGENGDRLELKSQLSKYLFLAAAPDEVCRPGSRIRCTAGDRTILSEFLAIPE
ncbi:MAG: polya polymerase [Clostridium sp.]|nr:polya polymerase [Clostridium sp.]